MDNQQLAKEGLTLVGQITAHRRVMTSDTAVAQLLCDTPELNAYFIAARQTAGAQEQANLVKLFQKIDQHFNDSELRNLAFRLGVEYENLTGETRRDKARELVTHMQRHVRLSELINQTAALRPRPNGKISHSRRVARILFPGWI